MTTAPTNDLNEIIVAAVNARVETAVIEALSGDATMGQFVAAALQQTVMVKDPSGSYREIKSTYLHETIAKAVQEATKVAVQKYLLECSDELEAAVNAAMRKATKDIAGGLVKQLSDTAKNGYMITVNFGRNS